MDYEQVFDKIKLEFFKAFAVHLYIMNEKRDDTTLFEPQAIYVESLDDEAKSFDHFAFIGTSASTGVTSGRAIGVTYEVEIDLFIPDKQNGKIQKELRRYNHVMMKAAQDCYGKVLNGYGNTEINILAPISANLNNSSRAYKLLGINLKFTMVYN